MFSDFEVGQTMRTLIREHTHTHQAGIMSIHGLGGVVCSGYLATPCLLLEEGVALMAPWTDTANGDTESLLSQIM